MNYVESQGYHPEFGLVYQYYPVLNSTPRWMDSRNKWGSSGLQPVRKIKGGTFEGVHMHRARAMDYINALIKINRTPRIFMGTKYPVCFLGSTKLFLAFKETMLAKMDQDIRALCENEVWMDNSPIQEQFTKNMPYGVYRLYDDGWDLMRLDRKRPIHPFRRDTEESNRPGIWMTKRLVEDYEQWRFDYDYYTVVLNPKE